MKAALPFCIPTFQPMVSPTTTRPSNAAVFVKVKVFWMILPVFKPLRLVAVSRRIIAMAIN